MNEMYRSIAMIMPNGSGISADHQFIATPRERHLTNRLFALWMFQYDARDVSWIVCCEIINEDIANIVATSH